MQSGPRLFSILIKETFYYNQTLISLLVCSSYFYFMIQSVSGVVK